MSGVHGCLSPGRSCRATLLGQLLSLHVHGHRFARCQRASRAARAPRPELVTVQEQSRNVRGRNLDDSGCGPGSVSVETCRAGGRKFVEVSRGDTSKPRRITRLSSKHGVLVFAATPMRTTCSGGWSKTAPALYVVDGIFFAVVAKFPGRPLNETRRLLRRRADPPEAFVLTLQKEQ